MHFLEGFGGGISELYRAAEKLYPNIPKGAKRLVLRGVAFDRAVEEEFPSYRRYHTGDPKVVLINILQEGAQLRQDLEEIGVDLKRCTIDELIGGMVKSVLRNAAVRGRELLSE